ncbi:MAG: hypothetical protein JOY67_21010 [Hyphomicrobiales bacterium]|nr:hypothetical protein [Hyphomicrobiales bacterium]MBV9521137.1 hypothetical protein [Hyphomicrobiales bacterium]
MIGIASWIKLPNDGDKMGCGTSCFIDRELVFTRLAPELSQKAGLQRPVCNAVPIPRSIF